MPRTMLLLSCIVLKCLDIEPCLKVVSHARSTVSQVVRHGLTCQFMLTPARHHEQSDA